MSKIFPPSFRASTQASFKRPVARIAFFAGALLMLWLASTLLPPRKPGASAAQITSAGTTVFSVSPEESGVAERSPRLFGPGYLIVLAILAGGIGLAIHLRRRTGGGSTTGNAMKTIGQMQITPQQHLRLVRCGEDVLLLGVSAGQITLLKTYSGETFSTRETTGSPRGETADVTKSRVEPFSSVIRQFAHSHVTPQAS